VTTATMTRAHNTMLAMRTRTMSDSFGRLGGGAPRIGARSKTNVGSP
jgi:hypothetical protein